MSKYVEEILKDLKNNPESFKDYNGRGVKKDSIIVSGYGNTRMMSIIDVMINQKTMPSTYIDKWKLEVGIMKWYKKIPLRILNK